MAFKLFSRKCLDIGSFLTKTSDGKVIKTQDFFKSLKNLTLNDFNAIAISSRYAIYLKRRFPLKDIKKVTKLIFSEIKVKFCSNDFVIYVYKEKEDKNYIYHIFFIDKSLLDENLKKLIDLENVYLDVLGIINGFNKLKKFLKKDSFIVADIGNSKISILKFENGKFVDYKKYLIENLTKEEIKNLLEKENVEILIGGKAKDFDLPKVSNPLFFIVNNLKENPKFIKLTSQEKKESYFFENIKLFSFMILCISIIFFIFALIYQNSAKFNTILFKKQYKLLLSKDFNEAIFLSEEIKKKYVEQILKKKDALDNYNKFIQFLNTYQINYTKVSIDNKKVYIKFWINKEVLNKIKDKLEIISSREDKDKVYIEGLLK